MWGCDSLQNFPFGFATASRILDKGGGAKNAPVLGAGSVDRMGRLGGWKFLHPFSTTERGAEVLTSDGDGSKEGDGVGILGYDMHSNGGGAQGPEMHVSKYGYSSNGKSGPSKDKESFGSAVAGGERIWQRAMAGPSLL